MGVSKEFWPVTMTNLPDLTASEWADFNQQIQHLKWWLPQLGGRYSVTDNGDGTFTHRWDNTDARTS